MENSKRHEVIPGVYNKTGVRESRAFMAVWYEDSNNWNAVQEWLEGWPQIRVWADATHDQEGKLHHHTMIWFKDAKTETAVAKWLQKTKSPLLGENQLNEFSLWADIRDAARYLRHLDCPKKVLYGEDHVVSSDLKQMRGWWGNSMVGTAYVRAQVVAEEQDVKNVCQVDLVQHIYTNGISTLAELILSCKEDPRMARYIRENWAQARDLVREAVQLEAHKKPVGPPTQLEQAITLLQSNNLAVVSKEGLVTSLISVRCQTPDKVSACQAGSSERKS